ncbi:MAG TPA: SIMPL domain-containing protein [Thermomonas sp.]|nr:SIMPL domain-containing protein [Thermomonas sp.]
MKRMALGLVLLLVALNLQAQTISGPPFIAVHGKAKAEVVPDVFPLEITLKDTSEDAARSQAMIEAHAERILATVKQMKLPDADVTVSNMSVAPEYRYDREDQKQVFVGNVYRRQIKLRFRKLTDLAKMIGTLPSAKEVLIDTGVFESSRSDEVRRSLMTQAVQDARLTGETMAKAVGKRLGDVHNVSNQGFNVRYVEGGVDDPPVVFSAAAPMDSLSVTGNRMRADVALREGRIELQQDVYVIYTLID